MSNDDSVPVTAHAVERVEDAVGGDDTGRDLGGSLTDLIVAAVSYWDRKQQLGTNSVEDQTRSGEVSRKARAAPARKREAPTAEKRMSGWRRLREGKEVGDGEEGHLGARRTVSVPSPNQAMTVTRRGGWVDRGVRRTGDESC